MSSFTNEIGKRVEDIEQGDTLALWVRHRRGDWESEKNCICVLVLSLKTVFSFTPLEVGEAITSFLVRALSTP